MSSILRSVVDFIAPDACQVCRRSGDGPSADTSLGGVRAAVTVPVRVGPVVNHPVCPRCARQLLPSRGTSIVAWRLPGGAVVWRGRLVLAPVIGAPGAGAHGCGPPGPVHSIAAFESNETLLKIIHALKFSCVTSLAVVLGNAIAARVPAPEQAVLVPVPMDTRARRRRGFNQAELLAAELSRRWRVPVASRAVVKSASTSPQSLASRERRLDNVMGAFSPGCGRIDGAHAIIVDDLVTTGATAAVVTAVLADAASVSVVSAGRAA